MKYQKKPVIVDAVQWNKHGDHPEVYKYPPTAQGRCKKCGGLNIYHGEMVVKTDVPSYQEYWMICPGDWITTDPEGRSTPCGKGDFEREFEPVKEIKVSRTVLSLKPPFSPMQHPEPRVGSVMLNWPSGRTREKVNEVYANKEGPC